MNTDSELFSQIRKGDKIAFEKIFRSYYSFLCSYANKYLKDTDVAEEIVQELFFQIWQKKDSLQITTSVKSYLFRSVHNSCINHIRQKTIHRKHEEIILSENIGSDAHDPDQHDEQGNEKIVRDAIDRLPTERRRIFIMSRFDELSYKEIAEKLRLSVKTVENQMGKALKFIRDELKDKIPLVILIIVEFFHQIFKN